MNEHDFQEINFFINGNPEGKARPRLGKYGNTYSPQKLWEKVVYLNCLKYKPKKIIDFPIYIYIAFSMRKPKYIGKKEYWHTKKPDIDNLAKGTIDALSKAKFWVDDNLISMCLFKKIYQEPTGCYISVSKLKENICSEVKNATNAKGKVFMQKKYKCKLCNGTGICTGNYIGKHKVNYYCDCKIGVKKQNAKRI